MAGRKRCNGSAGWCFSQWKFKSGGSVREMLLRVERSFYFFGRDGCSDTAVSCESCLAYFLSAK